MAENLNRGRGGKQGNIRRNRSYEHNFDRHFNNLSVSGGFRNSDESYNKKYSQKGNNYYKRGQHESDNTNETKIPRNESELFDMMRMKFRPGSVLTDSEAYQDLLSFSDNSCSDDSGENQEISTPSESSFCEDKPKTHEKPYRRRQHYKKQRNYTDDESISSAGSSKQVTKRHVAGGKSSNLKRECLSNKTSTNEVEVSLFDSWHEPRPFIQMVNGKLRMIKATADLIKQITYPSVVVSITGSYREGKSYLMNRIAGHSKGFSTSSALETHTKGVWIWCLPHPTKSQTALILLDTEGLDNAEEHNKDQDTMIMALLVLISSSLIYNTIGKIDAKLIEKLHFVVDVVSKIKINRGSSYTIDKTCCDYMLHFPNLILAIRDFYLDLNLNGEKVTPDEYLDNVLKLKTTEDSNSRYNFPRTVIRTAFKKHHCYVFPRPVHNDEMLKSLNILRDDKLNRKFVQQIKKFTEFIHEKSSLKRISEDEDMTGSLLISFTEACIKALNCRDSVVCVEQVMDSVMETKDKDITQAAFNIYKTEINKVNCPVKYRTLVSFNREATGKAINFFFRNISVRDLDNQSKILHEKIEEKFIQMRNYNDHLSFRKCRCVLDDLHKKKIKNVNFMFPGGYSEYERLMNEILTEYNSRCGQYIGWMESRNEFLRSKENEISKILNSDTKMSTADKLRADKDQKWRENQINMKDVKKENYQLERENKKFQENMNEYIKDILTERNEKLEFQLNKIHSVLHEERRKFKEEGFIREANEIQHKIEQMDRTNNWKTALACLAGGVVIGLCIGGSLPAVITALAMVPVNTWRDCFVTAQSLYNNFKTKM